MIYEQAVDQYLALGFALHWLHPKSKAPKMQGWSTAPVSSLEDLRRTGFPGDNLGCRAGHWSRLADNCGLVVLDIDLRAEEATNVCYEALERLVGDWSQTPYVASGRGLGGHLYFKCLLPWLPTKAATTVAEGENWKLEVLSTGKNVVLPPSIHPLGKPYQWREFPQSFPMVPQALLLRIDTLES